MGLYIETSGVVSIFARLCMEVAGLTLSAARVFVAVVSPHDSFLSLSSLPFTLSNTNVYA